jgi:transcriptional regulator with XRE-family HTH domain
MSFGKTLAGLREAAGLTQVELAQKAGVPIDTLRRWEQDRNLPRVNDALKLAKALEISLDELILAKDMQEEPADQGDPERPMKRKGKKGGGAA